MDRFGNRSATIWGGISAEDRNNLVISDCPTVWVNSDAKQSKTLYRFDHEEYFVTTENLGKV